MAVTQTEYRQMLQALLPPGAAWTREPDAVLTKLLDALAAELARIDSRFDALIDEADPRTISEMVADWEAALDLPDACEIDPVTQTDAERRNAVVGKYTGIGGASRQYFIDLAAALGFAITIEDTVTAHHWEIKVPGIEAQRLSVGTGAGHQVGEPLRTWGPERLLECTFLRVRPAHTVPTFTYGSTESYSITYD